MANIGRQKIPLPKPRYALRREYLLSPRERHEMKEKYGYIPGKYVKSPYHIDLWFSVGVVAFFVFWLLFCIGSLGLGLPMGIAFVLAAIVPIAGALGFIYYVSMPIRWYNKNLEFGLTEPWHYAVVCFDYLDQGTKERFPGMRERLLKRDVTETERRMIIRLAEQKHWFDNTAQRQQEDDAVVEASRIREEQSQALIQELDIQMLGFSKALEPYDY